MKNLNHHIFFRVNDFDYELLQTRAKATGLSHAGYLRQILRGYIPKDRPPPEYFEMIGELRVISVTMNDIVCKLNMTGEFDKEQYEESLRTLRESVLKIMKAVTVPERR